MDVAKLVATYPAAEEALLAALWDVMARMKKQFVNVPMVLEVGTANV